MKSLVMLGACIGAIIGGYIGSLLDHTGFGLWSIFFSTIGGILGIWAGYKVADR